MKHNLIFSGTEIINLDQEANRAIAIMNEKLERIYFGEVKVTSIKELDKDMLEIRIERDLPNDYFIEGGWLNLIDESIISGLSETAFMPGENQFIFPIIPFGKTYFSPDDEFYKLFKKQIKVFTGEVIDEIEIKPTESDITIKIQFKDSTPRRYKQDIFNLNSKYGNLWKLKGQTLKTELKEFSQICKRDQPKISAYKGLKTYLKNDYDITLDLTSNKTK